MTQIVVVGAGIIGLYTVFELIERGIDPHTITIIAEFFRETNPFTTHRHTLAPITLHSLTLSISLVTLTSALMK